MTTGRVLSRSMHPAEQPSYMHLQVKRTNRAQPHNSGYRGRTSGMYSTAGGLTPLRDATTRDAAGCCQSRPRGRTIGLFRWIG
jgi:hypothetical protein